MTGRPAEPPLGVLMASDLKGTTGAGKLFPDRLVSIDALRGFDMFWIAGGEDIFKALARWLNERGWIDRPIREHVETQLEHVEWDGFRFYDLIFPLFLFVVGVVLPFSLGKLRERGEPNSALYWRIFRRTVLLFALGLLCNNMLQMDFANLRVAGVLQRIALCYGLAALVVMHTGPRGQAVVTVALLVGYWALLAFVPAPESFAGDYSKQTNLAGYVDRHWLPGKIMKAYYEFGDNEGILSTFPAVATALLGALAGQLLLARQTPWKKVFGLVAAGFLCLAAGYLWSYRFPIIKNIWTSSFVLWAGGWSFLLLAFFYAVIDVLQFRAWAFFFVVIGANAITIYVVPHFIDFDKIARFFFGGLINHSGSFGPVLHAIGVVGIEWLFLLYLYRKRIFLRV
jgi:predicted acyltransferase